MKRKGNKCRKTYERLDRHDTQDNTRLKNRKRGICHVSRKKTENARETKEIALEWEKQTETK